MKRRPSVSSLETGHGERAVASLVPVRSVLVLVTLYGLAVSAALLGCGAPRAATNQYDLLRIEFEHRDGQPDIMAVLPDERSPVVVTGGQVVHLDSRRAADKRVLLSSAYSARRLSNVTADVHVGSPCLADDGRLFLVRRKELRSRDDAGNEVIANADELVLMDVRETMRAEAVAATSGRIEWFDARLAGGRGLAVIGWRDYESGADRVLVAVRQPGRAWRTLWSSEALGSRFVGLYGVLSGSPGEGGGALIYGLTDSLPNGKHVVVRVSESGASQIFDLDKSFEWTEQERRTGVRKLQVEGHVRTVRGMCLVLSHESANPEGLVDVLFVGEEGIAHRERLPAAPCGFIDAEDARDAQVVLGGGGSGDLWVYDVATQATRRIGSARAVSVAVPGDFEGDGSVDLLLLSGTADRTISGLPAWRMGLIRDIEAQEPSKVEWEQPFIDDLLSVQVVDFDRDGRDEIAIALAADSESRAQIVKLR